MHLDDRPIATANLHPASDGETAAQSGKQGVRLIVIDPRFRVSLRENLTLVAQRWWAYVVGAVLGLVSLVSAIVWGWQFGGWVAAVGLLFVIAAQVHAFHTVRKQRDEANERLTSAPTGLVISGNVGQNIGGDLISFKASPAETPSSLTSITDKTFRNERVDLDGYAYTSCHFDSVVFVFRGGPFSMSHNEIRAPMIDVSEAPGPTRAVLALHAAIADAAIAEAREGDES